MSDSASARQPGEIIYHFDVVRNSIPLAQFIDTARASQDIIDDFNDKLFDKQLKYDIHVRTPEDGSLIEVLSVLVTTIGAVFGFLHTDMGKAFFKGLTTKEPAAWAEELGASIRKNYVSSETTKFRTLPADGSAITANDAENLLESETKRRLEAEAVALILLRFLALSARDHLRSRAQLPDQAQRFPTTYHSVA